MATLPRHRGVTWRWQGPLVSAAGGPRLVDGTPPGRPLRCQGVLAALRSAVESPPTGAAPHPLRGRAGRGAGAHRAVKRYARSVAATRPTRAPTSRSPSSPTTHRPLGVRLRHGPTPDGWTRWPGVRRRGAAPGTPKEERITLPRPAAGGIQVEDPCSKQRSTAPRVPLPSTSGRDDAP